MISISRERCLLRSSLIVAVLSFRLLLGLYPTIHAQSSENELVNIKTIIPDISVDLKYATTDNFTGQQLYHSAECFLAFAAAQQLKLVQDSLRTLRTHNNTLHPEGLGLKIWDGYRPHSVQYLMWEIIPDSRYVADPKTGSIHNRGGAIDITLIDFDTKQELEMPTAYDYFGEEAHHDYMDLAPSVIANRTVLKHLMENVGGFDTYQAEWWHYNYPPSKEWPILDIQIK